MFVVVAVPLVVAVVVVGLALIPEKCQQQFFTVQTLLLPPSLSPCLISCFFTSYFGFYFIYFSLLIQNC